MTTGSLDTSYPAPRSEATMVHHVSSCRGPARLRTFSRMMKRGFRAKTIDMMSWNNVPRVRSRMPCWYPDFENGWHGNPAHSTSCSGTRSRI